MTATVAPLTHADSTPPTAAATSPGAVGPARAPSKRARRAGYALSGVASLFLLFDAVMKLLASPEAVEGTVKLGYAPSVLFGLGLTQLACLTLYLVPRTAVLGAVLWTGYLGGAIATHVRVGDPLFSHVLFPAYVAAMLWGGLWLRDERVRALSTGRPSLSCAPAPAGSRSADAPRGSRSPRAPRHRRPAAPKPRSPEAPKPAGPPPRRGRPPHERYVSTIVTIRKGPTHGNDQRPQALREPGRARSQALDRIFHPPRFRVQPQVYR